MNTNPKYFTRSRVTSGGFALVLAAVLFLQTPAVANLVAVSILWVSHALYGLIVLSGIYILNRKDGHTIVFIGGVMNKQLKKKSDLFGHFLELMPIAVIFAATLFAGHMILSLVVVAIPVLSQLLIARCENFFYRLDGEEQMELLNSVNEL